jgi:hypothetical protein
VGDARGGLRAIISTDADGVTVARVSCCMEVGGTNAEARLQEGQGGGAVQTRGS